MPHFNYLNYLQINSSHVDFAQHRGQVVPTLLGKPILIPFRFLTDRANARLSAPNPAYKVARNLKQRASQRHA